MKNINQKLAKAIATIQETQPDLGEELKVMRRSEAALNEASKFNEARVLEPASVDENFALESAGGSNMALETIVLRKGRPVLTVSNDDALLDINEVESQFWKAKLATARPLLIPAVKAIGRIEVENHPDYEWLGTGWLVDGNTVVTNRHVAILFGRKKGSKFVFRQGVDGKIKASIDFLEEFNSLAEATFQITGILHIEDEDGPDIALLRAEPVEGTSLPNHITLLDTADVEGHEVAVIGYPARDSRIPDQQLMQQIFGDVYDKKRLAPGIVTGKSRGSILHDCSTLGGNSGSAIVDLQTGKAVGLHFAGRYLEANFAVPAAVIKDRINNLRRPRRNEDAGGNNGDSNTALYNVGSNNSGNNGGNKDDSNINLQIPTIQTGTSSSIDLTIPIHVSVRLGDVVGGNSKQISAMSNGTAVHDDDAEEFITEGNPADYDDRDGYDPDFLEERVPLPKINTDSKKKDILRFDNNRAELKYCHFSVVMSKSRRQCFFSAVNIDGESSVSMKRGGWRLDPRIPETAQIMKECYGNPPKFSRGHMTRREDPIWGTRTQARLGNDDSMHVTNAVPQMQNMNAGIWLALENYALHNARKDDQRISVFTGPFFKPSDPKRYGVMIPIKFWKVIAFIHDDTGELCATGYTISQEEFLAEEEFIFGQHKTTQVSIRSIETGTGISFGPLAALDPLVTDTEAIENVARPLKALSEIRFV